MKDESRLLLHLIISFLSFKGSVFRTFYLVSLRAAPGVERERTIFSWKKKINK